MMSLHITRGARALAPVVLLASLVLLEGCSKADDDYTAVPDPTVQARAVQSAIAAAQSPLDHHAHALSEDDGDAPAMNAPMAATAPSADSPRTDMAAGAAPIGMARLLGRPPSAGDSTVSGALPAAIGAPHIYHLGADTFFLDQTSTAGITSDQQKRLTSLKENSAIAYATTQRKIDQGEQDLWVLSSSEAPDVAKIEAKVGEITRLTGQQRMTFIRAVGDAVAVLSDAQRKTVAGGSMQAAMAPAPSDSGMSVANGAPMEMSGHGKMSNGKGASGMGMGMGGGADAGTSGGMGHM